MVTVCENMLKEGEVLIRLRIFENPSRARRRMMLPPLFNVTPFSLCLQLGLLSSLLFSPAESAYYLNNNCPRSSNTGTAISTPNTTFQTNLDLLFSFLSSNATVDAGFYNATVGQEPSDDVVYGLFLCRGDVTPQVCEECVAAAVNKTRYFCQGIKEAVIWYDECILHYSNQSIFSRVMDQPILRMQNVENVTDPVGFNRTLEGLMESVRSEALIDRSGKKKYYATKEESYFAGTMEQRVYSLVQCTQDLSAAQCDDCMSRVIDYLIDCCSTRQGARTVFPSCSIRYELYPFYAVGAEAPAPTPLPPPPPPPSPPTTRGKIRLS